MPDKRETFFWRGAKCRGGFTGAFLEKTSDVLPIFGAN